MKKLTALAIKAALVNPGTYQDEDGLFPTVDKRGGAYWLLRLQRDGKQQDIGLARQSVCPVPGPSNHDPLSGAARYTC